MRDSEQEDRNDGDSTFGIMTNEPPFDWQLKASSEGIPIKKRPCAPAFRGNPAPEVEGRPR